MISIYFPLRRNNKDKSETAPISINVNVARNAKSVLIRSLDLNPDRRGQTSCSSVFIDDLNGNRAGKTRLDAFLKVKLAQNYLILVLHREFVIHNEMFPRFL